MNKIIKQYTQPAFLICLVILLLASGSMAFIKNYFEFWFVKEPIPPNKPLQLLDESKLEPFKVVQKHEIRDKDILESLGTEEYLQWTLKEDNNDMQEQPEYITVFVTYYEKPDAVPHVPEECYTGGGYQKSKSESIEFSVNIANDPSNNIKIPGRIVTFSKAGVGYSSFPVLYFFNVNGRYVNTRTEARVELAKNIRGRHSYFCKVEFVFNKSKAPDEKEALKMSEKVLAVLLPVLEKEHWPTKEQLIGK
jgi:hypothetical protein